MKRSHGADILLVEDNANDAELTTRALRKQNLANNLHWVKDGEEALQYLFAGDDGAGGRLQHSPAVILLDLKLPKVDGLQVLQRIKSDPRTKVLPVVVLTSSDLEQDRMRSYESGVNSFITKPVDFDKFVKAVADLGLYWMVLNRPPR
jgi:CheY-like chemotaxis protein